MFDPMSTFRARLGVCATCGAECLLTEKATQCLRCVHAVASSHVDQLATKLREMSRELREIADTLESLGELDAAERARINGAVALSRALMVEKMARLSVL